MHKIIQLMVFFILAFSFLAHSLSIPRKIFNLFFPEVTVELRNNAAQNVHVKCGAEILNQELLMLNRGDAISWPSREILLPLKWCYVHIDYDNKGVFWASHLRWQCRHCLWSIRDDAVYFYREKHKKWVKQSLGPLPLCAHNLDV